MLYSLLAFTKGATKTTTKPFKSHASLTSNLFKRFLLILPRLDTCDLNIAVNRITVVAIPNTHEKAESQSTTHVATSKNRLLDSYQAMNLHSS